MDQHTLLPQHWNFGIQIGGMETAGELRSIDGQQKGIIIVKVRQNIAELFQENGDLQQRKYTKKPEGGGTKARQSGLMASYLSPTRKIA